jgi:hypothetical protein
MKKGQWSERWINACDGLLLVLARNTLLGAILFTNGGTVHFELLLGQPQIAKEVA